MCFLFDVAVQHVTGRRQVADTITRVAKQFVRIVYGTWCMVIVSCMCIVYGVWCIVYGDILISKNI